MNANPKRLIIVPGHASFKADVTVPLPANFMKDDYWALQSFQKGEPVFYIEHIRQGLELLDNNSILIFSGGRTREESGKDWSEASTYYEIAKTLRNYQQSKIALETHARDSFQNLAYSIRKFIALTGDRPSDIFVVGWKFKEQRYYLHAHELHIPDNQMHYIGVNNPRIEDLDDTLVGEKKTLTDFVAYPRGDQSHLLAKRLSRDPWGDGDPKDY